MKKIFSILISLGVILLAIQAGSIQNSLIKPSYKPFHLFPIPVDNKIAFIDSTGSMFVEPIYEAAQLFSEGLCAVRTNGRYGFIDLDGNMVIKPIYDYATVFQEEVALVYLKGKPCFINHHGELVIKPSFESMTFFYDGRSYVWTNTKKAGVINKQGKLIIDTIYSHVNRFHSGLSVANIAVPNDDGEGTYDQQLIIDSLGRQITHAGQYYEIDGPFEGYFTASMVKNQDPEDILLDHTGRVVRRFSKGEYAGYQSRVVNGIINTTRYKRPNHTNSDSYEIYTKVNGQLVYTDKKTTDAQPFSEGFAFCKNKNMYVLINRKGKEIARYDEIKEPGFVNGRALVMKGNSWGAIDTTGVFVTKTINNLQDVMIVDDYLLFKKRQEGDYLDENALYGIADKTGNSLIAPTFQYFDKEGFVSGLLKTWVNYHVTYINKAGKIVWQQDTAKRQPITMNIDHMQRCFFSVRSENTGHPMRYGAEPKVITDQHHFPENQLSVTVDPSDTIHIDNTAIGIKVYLSNTLKDTVVFNAQDGVLYMNTQALDEEGQWKNIDFMPHSWCGNSYHSVALAGNSYWQLAVPRYSGTLNTKLRIEITYVHRQDTTGTSRPDKPFKGDGHSRWKAKELKAYSNTFDGSINPGQLWRRASYSPDGIMDPYNE